VSAYISVTHSIIPGYQASLRFTAAGVSVDTVPTGSDSRSGFPGPRLSKEESCL
jgi:hypothetical protein